MNYGLYANVQFGLKMRGVNKKQRESRADEMLEMVQLDQFADRKPHQLSGGQQQRVALARALAPRPKLLLLDEPLSALDLKLRQSMRLELKKIQEQTGITFVFVTHDQEKALTMSDRIAVISSGRLQQIGTPTQIYEEPINRFVADFIGETNFLEVSILEQKTDSAVVSFSSDATSTPTPAKTVEVPYNHKIFMGPKGILSVRPERIHLTPFSESDPGGFLQGEIKQAIYMGTDTQYVVELPWGQQLLTRRQNTVEHADIFAKNDRVSIGFDTNSTRLLRR